MTRLQGIRVALLAVLVLCLVGLALTLPADTIVLGLLILAAPAINLYPLVYCFRPWRSTPQGRALMQKALGNVILIDMGLATLIFGDYPFRDAIRITGFALFALGVNNLFWTLISSPGADKYPPRSWFQRARR